MGTRTPASSTPRSSTSSVAPLVLLLREKIAEAWGRRGSGAHKKHDGEVGTAGGFICKNASYHQIVDGGFSF
jgi:hypothetical protein